MSVHEVAIVALRPGVYAVRKALRAEYADRDDLRCRLLCEGAWLTRCGRRRHVLGCHTVDPDTPALLLEHAPGGTLAHALHDDRAPGIGRRLPWQRVRDLAHALGDALAHVHACGLVHRDVKPSNVLLAADGAPRLADFGTAAPIGSRGTLAPLWEEVQVGTLGYAAPEQLADPGSAVQPAADVHAFGVVLYELATGRLPWELQPGEDEAALRARVIRGTLPTSPLSFRPALGAPVARVLGAALHPDPAGRPPTVSALAEQWAAAWNSARATLDP